MISWSEKVETGNRVMDTQHKELVFRYNKLIEISSNKNHDRIEIGFLLDDLLDYTIYHFNSELILQKLTKDKSLKLHKNEHDKFIKHVTKLQEKFDTGKDVSNEMLTFVKKWLVDHILGTDMDFGKYLLTLDQNEVERCNKIALKEIEKENKIKCENGFVFLNMETFKKFKENTPKRKNGVLSCAKMLCASLSNIGSLLTSTLYVMFCMLIAVLSIHLNVDMWLKYVIIIPIIIFGAICIFVISNVIGRIFQYALKIFAKEMSRVVNLNVKQKSHLSKLKLLSHFWEFRGINDSFQTFFVGLENYLKFLPLQIVQSLVRSNRLVQLNLKYKMATVVFNDIASFTTISEKLDPQDLISLLERFCRICNQGVEQHGGFVLNFLGDGLIMLFNQPKYIPNHPLKAIRATIDIIKKFKEMNEKGDYPVLHVRFGINSDHMLVGNVGDVSRMYYTVLGDSVNISARLEALGKVYKTQIVISEKTQLMIKNSIQTRWIDSVLLKGKKDSMNIYTVNESIKNVEKYSKICDLSIKARNMYCKKEFEEVGKILSEIIKIDEHDVPANLLLKRLKESGLGNELLMYVQEKESELENTDISSIKDIKLLNSSKLYYNGSVKINTRIV